MGKMKTVAFLGGSILVTKISKTALTTFAAAENKDRL